MTESAVLDRPHHPLQILEVALESPRAGEVTVQIGATGVCHSDIAVFTEKLANPMPVVLGHEGDSTVVEVGVGVENLAPGDRVVLSWLAQRGECFSCLKGQPQLCETAWRGCRKLMCAFERPSVEAFIRMPNHLADTGDQILAAWTSHGEPPCAQAGIRTGYSNARSEGYNRLVKCEGRNAFRSSVNQTTRRTSGLHPPTPAGVSHEK